MKPASCRLVNGNCTVLDADTLPVQCVGAWTREKHDYLLRYIEASAAARAKYLPPQPGGAAFIDLFAGPGRARVRETGDFIDGSPLIALKHSRSPFTRVILCDNDPVNVAALQSRVQPYGNRASVIPGDCNVVVQRVVDEIPPYGLNMAFVDPYNLAPLDFGTLKELCGLRRMDLLIHFPTAIIRRAFYRVRDALDRFLGTTDWRQRVANPSQVPQLIPILRERLTLFGYDEQVRSMPVRFKNRVLYHIFYASKDPLGTNIWQSVSRITAGGQRSLF